MHNIPYTHNTPYTCMHHTYIYNIHTHIHHTHYTSSHHEHTHHTTHTRTYTLTHTIIMNAEMFKIESLYSGCKGILEN